MTTSNEPGYYEDGAFGIRIENVCITTEAVTPNHFGGRTYVSFETVTVTPIQTKLVDLALLSDAELKWLNSYNACVRQTLLPVMQIKFPEAVSYLIKETEAVDK